MNFGRRVILLLLVIGCSLVAWAGPFLSTKRVALRASDKGFFVSAEGGGKNGAVNCNRTQRGPWETFVLLNYSSKSDLRSGDVIALKAGEPNETFFLAQSEDNKLRCYNGDPWTFRIYKADAPDGAKIESGDVVLLRAENGMYASAEGGGGQDISWNRVEIGPWEKFVVDFI